MPDATAGAAATGASLKFEGFDFNKNADPAKSAKYAFAAAAQRTGSMPTSKAEAETWFSANIKGEMESRPQPTGRDVRGRLRARRRVEQSGAGLAGRVVASRAGWNDSGVVLPERRWAGRRPARLVGQQWPTHSRS